MIRRAAKAALYIFLEVNKFDTLLWYTTENIKVVTNLSRTKYNPISDEIKLREEINQLDKFANSYRFLKLGGNCSIIRRFVSCYVCYR